MPSTFDQLKHESELVGLTTALERLTVSVEQQYLAELEQYDSRWQTIENRRDTEQIFAERCFSFLETLKNVRGRRDQANELASCLLHPSYDIEFSNLFRRAELSGNVRALPSAIAGKNLVDLIISTHLLETGWTETRSVSAHSNANRYLGNYALTEKFWSDSGLASPLVGTGFTYEKGFLDKAYKKLAHALLLYEGYQASKDFVIASLRPTEFLSVFAEEIEIGDPKTLLQEYFQAYGQKPPNYKSIRVPGTPDHEPEFEVSLLLPNAGILTEAARSKKEGTIAVAEKAIKELKRKPNQKKMIERLIATKAESSFNMRRREPTVFIPNEVSLLADQLEGDFGVSPDAFRLLQALKTKNKGTSRFEHVPNNEVISRVGALVMEFALINSHPDFKSLGTEAVHPRILDEIYKRHELNEISCSVFRPLRDWGVNVDRQIAQSVIFSLFVNDQNNFFDIIKRWLRTNQAFTGATAPQTRSTRTPVNFDEKFSYVTVLQEFTQSMTEKLPKYSKISSGPDHDATHTAFCTFDGRTTKGTGSRYNWARNTAAYAMLVELDYFGE